MESESDKESTGGSKSPRFVASEIPLYPMEHRCWCGERRIDTEPDSQFWKDHKLEHKKEDRRKKS